MITSDMIQTSYHDLRYAKECLYEATEKEIDAKEVLEKAEADLLMSGAIIGKNTEAREAEIRRGTNMEYLMLKEAEANKRKAILDFDLIAIKCQEYREVLKLLSLPK